MRNRKDITFPKSRKHGEITMTHESDQSQGSTTSSVLAEVADALKASPEGVKSRLVTALVEREVVKRVELLDKGLSKLRELKSEINKVRPPVSYTATGEKVEGNFSKADFESLKKLRERLSKLEAAMEKAFTGQEFDKLAGLVGGKEAPAESSEVE
jgi:hypothetical protein